MPVKASSITSRRLMVVESHVFVIDDLVDNALIHESDWQIRQQTIIPSVDGVLQSTFQRSKQIGLSSLVVCWPRHCVFN